MGETVPTSESGASALPVGGGGEERLARQLMLLMGARLAIATTSLGVGLALDLLGGHVTVIEWEGFYTAAAVAFVATLAYRPFIGKVGHPRRFAALNIALDMGLVSALVLFSGGSESIFTFLYMVIVISAAAFFRRGEALAWGLGAGWTFGLVLMAEQGGWWTEAPAETYWPQLITVWGVHTGALVLVSALTSFLAIELDRAGRALDQRTEALFHLQTLHQRTVESLMSGLLTTDGRGRITSFNAEAERICGCSRDVAIGADIDEILTGVRSLLVEAGHDAKRGRARMAFRNLEGESLHLGVGTYVLKDAGGSPSGNVVIFQDVSEVVQMERELRRSERLAAVGELSASIAHEIRNPLAAISGSIEIMQRRLAAEEGESGRLMDIVVREVERLDLLITDFLHFARPGPSKIEPLALRPLVGEVLQMFDSVRPPWLALEIDVEEGLVLAADAAQVRQVLWNLILNASQAMSERGCIRFEARTLSDGMAQDGVPGGRSEPGGGGWAEIIVMDQGTGIPADVADQIFDPFFTTRREGSGLGLATVYRIVEDHGGSIRLGPAPEGFMTAIHVHLPLAGSPS
jgi:two-component system sensor histidine kinase PilS (NtrC family)